MMKLKYKKIILIISMSTMGIGLITLSMSKPNSRKKLVEVSSTLIADSTGKESASINDTTDNLDDAQGEQANNARMFNEDLDNSATMKLSEADNSLKRDAYEDVNKLVNDYLTAIAKSDVDALSKIVSDANSIDTDEIQRKSEYVEEYKNIECYTKNGREEGSYIVYVYEELKLVGIDTLAPGMIRLYVSTSEDGKPYIVSGKIDDETNDFITEASKDEEVVNLLAKVNNQFDVAVASDTSLREFLQKIEKGIKEAEATISEAKKPR